MEESRRYERSPLTEALIDLRCTLPASVTLDMLASVQIGEEDRYPARQDRLWIEGEFTGAGGQVSASASQSHIGYMFWNREHRQGFQARLDGFTFNRLAPCDRWNTFRDEARRLWERYRAVTTPEGITRVAVRYINRLDLPLEFDDFKDYLRTVPEVSPDMLQAVSGYFMRLELPQDDIGATLLLNQALVPPKEPDTVSFLLDIDLFREYAPAIGDDDAWSYLERLRVRKNEVFEACITDHTREVIG